MAEINDLLSNISNIKTDIKSAIENKGQNVTNFASYPNAISNIVSGGGGVKQYDSLENMYADVSNAHNGDLATVYASSQAGIIETTEFQVATFPETVVLDTALSDYVELSFQAVDESQMFDCWGQLDSNYFRMDCYTDDDINIRIEYESQDGITYNRTGFMKNEEDVSGNEMDFGMLIKFGNRWGESEFNSVISKFIIVGTTVFDGLFQYIGTNFNLLPNTGLNATINSIYNGKFYGISGIENGTLSQVTNLNLQQLKDRVNLYSNISSLNLSENIENVENMFAMLNIKYVPNINFASTNAQSLYQTFWTCANLINVPNFNISKITNLVDTFNDCTNLEAIPNFDTSNLVIMDRAFELCYNLVNVPVLNLINVTNMRNTFKGCRNLSETSLSNIANSVPYASQLNNSTIYTIGIMSNKFNSSARTILYNKGYLDCDDNTSGWSTQYNVYNGSTWKLYNREGNYDRYGLYLTNIIKDQLHATTSSVTNIVIKSANGVDNGILMLEANSYGMDGIFSRCSNLKSANVAINMCNVIDTGSMFARCYNLINVSNFNTINVTNMSMMFYECNNLASIPNFDTSNVVRMSSMFCNCYNLKNSPNFNTAKVRYMSMMFNECNNLTNVVNYNTSNVEDMFGMFSNCQKLTTIPNFNTPNLQRTSNMFFRCYNLTNVPNFNTSKVTDMNNMFFNCRNLIEVPNFDTSNTVYMDSMFRDCQKLFNVPNFDMNNVKDVSAMFYGCNNLKSVPNFNLSTVSNLDFMFASCYNLLEVPNFNIDYAITTSHMFSECYNLVNAPALNLISVTNTSNMFFRCYNLVNVPEYDMSDIVDAGAMFEGCNNLSTASLFNIANSNMGNMTNMWTMFAQCNTFNTLPVFKYNTEKFIDMSGMFSSYRGEHLNISNLSNWNLTNVNIYEMFYESYFTEVKDVIIANTKTASGIFQGCQQLTTVTNVLLSDIKEARYTFNWCKSLNSVSNLIFRNIGSMDSAFERCNSLVDASDIQISNVNSLYYCFNGCTNLMNAPIVDASNTTSLGGMFYNCTNLVNVPEYNTAKATMQATFAHCNNLSDASIQNIINMCLNSNSPEGTKILRPNYDWGPFAQTNIVNTRYQNRWTELDAAGWTY